MRFCDNCPWKRSSPKAGEPGGSIPDVDARESYERIRDGHKVMQCHDSKDSDPRPCAGFLSVVGFDSLGVRFAVALGLIPQEDVGRKVPGLYSSLDELMREANHMDPKDWK